MAENLKRKKVKKYKFRFCGNTETRNRGHLDNLLNSPQKPRKLYYGRKSKTKESKKKIEVQILRKHGIADTSIICGFVRRNHGQQSKKKIQVQILRKLYTKTRKHGNPGNKLRIHSAQALTCAHHKRSRSTEDRAYWQRSHKQLTNGQQGSVTSYFVQPMNCHRCDVTQKFCGSAGPRFRVLVCALSQRHVMLGE